MKHHLEAYETLMHSLEELAQANGQHFHISQSQKKELSAGYKDHQKSMLAAPELFLKYGKKHQVKPLIEKIAHYSSKINETDLDHLLHACFEAYNRNDFSSTLTMLTFIITLLPLYVKAYLLMGNTLWKLKGIETASHFYETIIVLIHDPLLYFYAADCIAHNNNKTRAIELLDQAREWCKNHKKSSIHQDLLNEIDAYSKNLLH